MSSWKNFALVVGGASIGYLASRFSRPSQQLQLRMSDTAKKIKPVDQGEQAVAKFFNTPLGATLQPVVLRALKFAAAVKSGMDEKEAELKERFEKQKEDMRPGSLDTWDRPLASSSSDQDREELDRNQQAVAARIARDKELGDDFFI
ncbi:MAG: peptide chain release factor 4 [Rothia sp. (in: high G+C Gram-positive bacteria)]|nr:peptide chain release factor 4 [Rothia sp. (in: high G+C Gram-positive bacteria)]